MVTITILALPSASARTYPRITDALAVTADSLKKLRRLKWLLNVFASPGIVSFIQSRDDDDRDGGEGWILPSFFQKLPAVQPWHHQIQQDDAGQSRAPEPVESLLPIPSTVHPVAFPFKEHFHGSSDQEVVFNY